MLRCRTRRSTSPMETSPSTSGRRSSPATTSRPRSLPRSAVSSTSRRAGEEGFDEIIVRVGPGKGRKVRFAGVLLGEWVDTSLSRVETFRVYRGRTGKFVVHIERGPDFTMVDERGQAGRLARLPRHRRNVSYGTTPGESTLEVVESLDELRERIPPQLYDMVAGSAQQPRRRGPRHLSVGLASPRSAGRCGMTADGIPAGDPRHRAAQVVRQAGRPRRHRPRGRRGHGLRAARAERRRQDDDGPHPVDPDRRRRRRGARSPATTSRASPMPCAPSSA